MKGYIKQKEDTQETRERKVPSLSGLKKKKKRKDYSNYYLDIYFYMMKNRTRNITLFW